ncbi:SLIT-ROBO Rho GTPase-activating protein 3-like [Leptonychotes weddellii]|uniref:SLIT-ROBO Rho GTPase-activating protein 3-like n=1 Tax=Leptonychotes weddellii TaxID=9713 RepID=A0A7F8R1W6_LEPWE|nr:SLIT-ROBO Rho GTPase-activating protein 3-like [Leptonychotes weddellii]
MVLAIISDRMPIYAGGIGHVKDWFEQFRESTGEIRTQLVEQFKCLEQQSESRLQLLQDLQEFFRRKAEIELEYSRSLEKLAERFSSKIRSSREHQFKKDQYLLSPVNCWYLVLHQTRRESRDHATLNDIFMNNVIVRLSQISEDVIRLFKKVGKGATPPAQISLPQAKHYKIASQGGIWFGGMGPGGQVC